MGDNLKDRKKAMASRQKSCPAFLLANAKKRSMLELGNNNNNEKMDDPGHCDGLFTFLFVYVIKGNYVINYSPLSRWRQASSAGQTGFFWLLHATDWKRFPPPVEGRGQ